jgi:TRAP-type mannitol/chloroaromatic compound transport system permease small subunit
LEERVKVPWPVSEREALLHYFELEYLKEDLVIVIMKTVRMFFPFIFFLFWEPLPTTLMLYALVYLSSAYGLVCRYQIWII